MALKNRIEKHFHYLTENLKNLESVLNHCIGNELISFNEREIILANIGSIAVNSKLFQFLTRECRNQYNIISILRDTDNQHLADLLEPDFIPTRNVDYKEEYNAIIAVLEEEYFESDICKEMEHCRCDSEIQTTLEWRHWKILDANKRFLLKTTSLLPDNMIPRFLSSHDYYQIVLSLKKKHRSIYNKFRKADLKYLYDIFRASAHFTFKYNGEALRKKSDFVNGDISVEELHAYRMRPRCLKVSSINVQSLCDFGHLSAVCLSSFNCSVSLENLVLLPKSVSILHLVNVNFSWGDLLTFLSSISFLEELIVFGNFYDANIFHLDCKFTSAETKVIRWFLGNKQVRKHSFDNNQLKLILNDKSKFLSESENRYPYHTIIVKPNVLDIDSFSLNIRYPELVETIEFKHTIPVTSITQGIAKFCINVTNLKLTNVTTEDLLNISAGFCQNVISLYCLELKCKAKNASKVLERFILKCNLDSLILINCNVQLQLDIISKLGLKTFHFHCLDIPPNQFSIVNNSMNLLELESLTEMKLNSISISSDTLKLLLFSCSCLEILSLEWLKCTVNLKYVSKSVKQLKIVCTEIEKLGSSFSNGDQSLEKLDVRYVSLESLQNALKSYSSCIQDFSLWGMNQSIDVVISNLIQCPENFMNLKLLKLVGVSISNDILTQWTTHSTLLSQLINETLTDNEKNETLTDSGKNETPTDNETNKTLALPTDSQESVAV